MSTTSPVPVNAPILAGDYVSRPWVHFLQDAAKPDIIIVSATINAQTTTKQEIYKIPAGNSFVPLFVVFGVPTASLSGLTDMDIGGNASADDWLQQVSLDAFTSTDDYGLVAQPEQSAGPPIVPVKKTIYTAGTSFGVKINTGASSAAEFTADLYGRLF